MDPIKELAVKKFTHGELYEEDFREAAEKIALGQSYSRIKKTQRLLNQLHHLMR
jgi:hypothetical protein